MAKYLISFPSAAMVVPEGPELESRQKADIGGSDAGTDSQLCLTYSIRAGGARSKE
jgi:hypothetical protein